MQLALESATRVKTGSGIDWRNPQRTTHNAAARRVGRVGNAGRTSHDEKGDEMDEMKTPGERRTTGRKMRQTARKIWAAGAQFGVKSGWSERKSRASCAKRHGKAGENGWERKRQCWQSAMLIGHSNKLSKTNLPSLQNKLKSHPKKEMRSYCELNPRKTLWAQYAHNKLNYGNAVVYKKFEKRKKFTSRNSRINLSQSIAIPRPKKPISILTILNKLQQSELKYKRICQVKIQETI